MSFLEFPIKRYQFTLIAFALLVAPLRRWRASASLGRGLQLAGAGLFAWLAARLALVERV
jgi:hypothetical protein